MLHDNTTVRGTWTQVSNMTEISSLWNRTVNNVTMAMPHAGIVKAAMDPRNDIKQPQDLSVSVVFSRFRVKYPDCASPGTDTLQS